MCMWFFEAEKWKNNFWKTKKKKKKKYNTLDLDNFEVMLQYGVSSLCNQLLLEFSARYRLKYCLKGSLNPKQPTNQAINLKLCTDVTSLLKMCMRIFADEKINFDKITAFSS